MPQRALISVYDKEGLELLGPGLAELGYEIISTGGSRQYLEQNGVPCREVAEITGQAELFSGRVKTLHPAVQAAILARRDQPGDLEQLQQAGWKPIDLVVVNLYPFARTRREEKEHGEILENIDIGGPTLIRAAAKNYRDVLIIVDPADYSWILEKLRAGRVERTQRRQLAARAFAHTAAYEQEIAGYFAGEDFETFPAAPEKVRELRYGENPQQKAALYRRPETSGTVVGSRQLGGKPLSYNNLLDAEAAWQAVREFSDPAWVLVKHGNPCGLGAAQLSGDALEKACRTDPLSAFGAVVASNRQVGEEEALYLAREPFIEVLLAPRIKEEGSQVLQARWKNIRLLETGGLPPDSSSNEPEIRSLQGGFLVQDTDIPAGENLELQVVSAREPSPGEREELIFAWQGVKHVRSNAILLARDRGAVGIGAGQMSRVDAARMAIWKAGERAAGSFLASDAFIPFADTLELAREAGVQGIIQPGGAKRDQEVIEAANRLNLIMVFTGRRHFRH